MHRLCAKLTAPGWNSAGFSETGNARPAMRVREKGSQREREREAKQEVAILAQAVSGSSPWGALCEPSLSVFLLHPPLGQPNLPLSPPLLSLSSAALLQTVKANFTFLLEQALHGDIVGDAARGQPLLC